MINPLIVLSKPLSTLTLMGPRNAKNLARLNVIKLFDALTHRPTGLLHRRLIDDIGDASVGELIIVKITVVEHRAPPFGSQQRRQPYIIHALNNGNPVRLIFFNAHAKHYLGNLYKINQCVTITGKLESFNDIATFNHPEVFSNARETRSQDGCEPIYPLTGGITLPLMQAIIHTCLNLCPDLPEWISPETLKLLKATSWKSSLHTLHTPKNDYDVGTVNPARQRLAFDELLANQLALLSIRYNQQTHFGIPFTPTNILRNALLQHLPYKLTHDQQKVLREIDGDLSSTQPMMRLLQGDVGSGKTIVALLTMLAAVEHGAQAALMAPTEILSRQHAATMIALLDKINIKAVILTGRDKGKNRENNITAIARGDIHIVIGTHALIQDDVIFKNLGIVIIDEQHRFGVEQRLKLVEKGHGVNVLSMTATPIPRTLTLACYGDLECSYLREKPAQRQEIITLLYGLNRLEEIIHGLQRALSQGHKIYWVCPLVEETETSDLAAATERFTVLSQFFVQQVGLIHGRLKSDEKTLVMDRFKRSEIKILVATTVIEVGVDVPDATIIIIEHAERFGLAQLHQLRGRVGRGHQQGICMLLYQKGINHNAQSRLKIMRETNDGFRIAEEDSRLRGAGDLAGLRQSGLPTFAFADLTVHQTLLKLAQREAEDILHHDPHLQSPRGQAIKILLHLYNKQECLRLLSAV